MNVFKISTTATTSAMECTNFKMIFKTAFNELEKKLSNFSENNIFFNIISIFIINVLLVVVAMNKKKISFIYNKYIKKQVNAPIIDLVTDDKQLEQQQQQQQQQEIKLELV